MYIRDFISTKASVKPVQPLNGLYHNVFITDKRRGLFPAAIAPVGTVNITSEDDKFVVMEAVSPVTYIPSDAQMSDKESSTLTQEFLTAHKILTEITKPEYMEWAGIAFPKESRSANIPVEALMRRNKWYVTHDYQYIDAFVNSIDYIFWLSKYQDLVTRTYMGAGTLVPVPIGLAACFDDPKDGSYRVQPKRTLRMGDTYVDMVIPESTMSMRMMREVFKWHVLLAAALQRFMSTPGMKKKFNWTEKDYLAMAAYMIGAFRGWNTTIDDNMRYTAEDIYQSTLPYLGLPFSDVWPDIAMPPEIVEHPDIFQNLIILNVTLAMASLRAGTHVTPIHYIWRRGNIHVAKKLLHYYLRPILELGGNDSMWLQPALNTSLKHGIFMPGLITEGQSNWIPNVTEKSEQFVDMPVNRGEADIGDLDQMNSNVRLVTSRDARLRVVRDKDQEFILLVYKIIDGMLKKSTFAEEFVMSYLADPINKPKNAVWISAAWMREPMMEYALGIHTTVQTSKGPRTQIPGNALVDTDISEQKATAQPTTPVNKEEVMQRTQPTATIPLDHTNSQVVLETPTKAEAKRK